MRIIHKIRITDTELHRRLMESEIKVATDVNNPLLGKEGATYVFAPQKGAKR